MENILKEKLLPHYQELLLKVANLNNVWSFAIQWGAKYEKGTGMLFVGKATNGWITNTKEVSVLFGESEERIFARKDQMQWVSDLERNKNGYNTRKSAFWRVIKNISLKFTDKQWSSQIAWSNLYKIAPEKGNPDANLRRIQIDICKKILKTEIETLQPKYVIFLTSGWENVFVSELFTNAEIIKTETVKWGKGDKYLTKGHNIAGVTYIFSQHPQGKNEVEHKNAIIKIIELLNK